MDNAQLKKVAAAVTRLAETDPQDEAVKRTVDVLNAEAKLLGGEVEKPAGFSGSFGEHSVEHVVVLKRGAAERGSTRPCRKPKARS